MQQEIQEKKIFQAKLSIQSEHSILIDQVLQIDTQDPSKVQINSQENQLELIFEGNDPKIIRSNIKHTLDQLLLVLETIQYAKK